LFLEGINLTYPSDGETLTLSFPEDTNPRKLNETTFVLEYTNTGEVTVFMDVLVCMSCRSLI